MSAAWSELRWAVTHRMQIGRLQRAVVERARELAPAAVFAVLNNAVIMTLAHRVAGELGLPLTALVWDPPDYVLRHSGFAFISRRWFTREFERSLARCRRVAVVSESMQADYAKLTDAPVQLLRHGRSMPSALAPPVLAPLDRPYWLIGFAGSMYAECAFKALVEALDKADWQIAGRPVRLRVMTAKIELQCRGKGWIEFLGYRDDQEVDQLLADCDVNYLPQPFKPHLAGLCRYAFPTKLAAYLAADRPVFVHCPDDSALGDYFDRYPFGAICRSLDSTRIVGALQGLLGDTSNYIRASALARAVGTSDFSEAAFHAAIDALFATAQDVSARPVDQRPMADRLSPLPDA